MYYYIPCGHLEGKYMYFTLSEIFREHSRVIAYSVFQKFKIKPVFRVSIINKIININSNKLTVIVEIIR